jgi:hypothetical protein
MLNGAKTNKKKGKSFSFNSLLQAVQTTMRGRLALRLFLCCTKVNHLSSEGMFYVQKGEKGFFHSAICVNEKFSSPLELEL